ncbi:hypothetical protein HYPSUDRAFT_41529 [Hypholoma sublateritium FD-334 SS-4]|uniref:Uncharacterized protein n=1 Tax=Hypholoma sublateritium (strain FD-334 SS-4) TaxID=945553 RepID=A0A0D2L4X1_HYPSF|nr:hypothetical protein HYPSUDRAFT_41529 [Hypholoma sublateritium FD-334 SS-4]
MGRLFNQSIYLALLRAVIFFSVLLSANYFLFLLEEVEYDGQWNLPFIALFFSILAHQIAYAFKVPYLCDNFIDIIWIFCDTLGLIAYGVFFSELVWGLQITQKVIWVALVTLYTFLLSARVYLCFKARKRVEKRPFNIREMGGISIIFGKSLWKARLIGETKRLVVARGIFASSLLAGVMAFFYVSVFTGAFQELQFVPTQNIRTAAGEIPVPGLLSPAVWGVTLRIFNTTYVPNFPEAIEVTPLWDNSCEVLPIISG